MKIHVKDIFKESFFKFTKIEYNFAHKIFSNPITLRKSVSKLEDLPSPNTEFPEIAFAGRSNVGKSSLMNALFGIKIAKVSSIPGKTQTLNFFSVGNKAHIVDMPGYGFSSVPLEVSKNWFRLVTNYVQNRNNLRRVLVLVDSRLNKVMENDLKFLRMLNHYHIPSQIILTKIDKASPNYKKILLPQLQEEIIKLHCCLPHIIETSAIKKINVDELRVSLALTIANIEEE